MPNWCANSLRIAALTDQGKATFETIRAELAKDDPRLFNAVHPIPADLHVTEGYVGDPVEQKALEAAQAANVEKHGYRTWYDFCCTEWGTKWDARVDTFEDDGECITIYFDTAWSPPIGFYQKLMTLGLSVEATYCEQGMGFAGYWIDGTDNEFSVSFCEEDDESDDIENMFAWFADQGMSHHPSHCGG